MTLELKIIPPVQFLICTSLMPVLAYYFPQLSFTLTISTVVIIMLMLLASTFSILALYNFRKHQTTHHPHTPEKTSIIVNTGIYAHSRNPMYLSLALILTALALYLSNFSCFSVIVFFIWYNTRFQIVPEEKVLEKKFPKEYQAYKEKVRRWL